MRLCRKCEQGDHSDHVDIAYETECIGCPCRTPTTDGRDEPVKVQPQPKGATMKYDFTDEEHRKLPKWAQSRVSSMRYRIRELEQLHAVQVKTDVSFGRSMNGENGYLPHQTPVRIHFDERTYIEFMKLDSENYIRVNANPNSLIIIPHASNAAGLMVEER